MKDIIYRQDAIDEVVAWLKDRMTDGKNGKPLTDRLKDLPSVQPEVLACGSGELIAQPERKMQCNFCSMSICTLKDRPCSRQVVKE